MREQNALPYETWIMESLTAKDDVDNVGAGRAAKGENPVASTKTAISPLVVGLFLILRLATGGGRASFCESKTLCPTKFGLWKT